MGRDGGWGDQWNVVFAHGVVERGQIFREDFVPFSQLGFQSLIQVSEDCRFCCGGGSVGAID